MSKGTEEDDVREVTCPHSLLLKPIFDEEAAKKLQAECKHAPSTNWIDAMVGICGECKMEIRKRWPRTVGFCSSCNTNVIWYASHEHFIYGDW